jgi:hypothetical protein
MKKLLLLLVLCNCQPKSTEVVCPDGNKCFVMDCTDSSYSDCALLMGKLCPKGYSTLRDGSSQYLIECHKYNPFEEAK